MNDDISTFPTGKTSEAMPTTKPRPHKMSFKDKIDAIDRLMRNVQFNEDMSEAFDINSCVKQDGVLVPTLFNIFFSILLKNAF